MLHIAAVSAALPRSFCSKSFSSGAWAASVTALPAPYPALSMRAETCPSCGDDSTLNNVSAMSNGKSPATCASNTSIFCHLGRSTSGRCLVWTDVVGWRRPGPACWRPDAPKPLPAGVSHAGAGNGNPAPSSLSSSPASWAAPTAARRPSAIAVGMRPRLATCVYAGGEPGDDATEAVDDAKTWSGNVGAVARPLDATQSPPVGQGTLGGEGHGTHIRRTMLR